MPRNRWTLAKPLQIYTYTHTYIHTHIHTHIHIYMYMHIYVCMVVFSFRNENGKMRWELKTNVFFRLRNTRRNTLDTALPEILKALPLYLKASAEALKHAS